MGSVSRSGMCRRMRERGRERRRIGLRDRMVCSSLSLSVEVCCASLGSVEGNYPLTYWGERAKWEDFKMCNGTSDIGISCTKSLATNFFY